MVRIIILILSMLAVGACSIVKVENPIIGEGKPVEMPSFWFAKEEDGNEILLIFSESKNEIYNIQLSEFSGKPLLKKEDKLSAYLGRNIKKFKEKNPDIGIASDLNCHVKRLSQRGNLSGVCTINSENVYLIGAFMLQKEKLDIYIPDLHYALKIAKKNQMDHSVDFYDQGQGSGELIIKGKLDKFINILEKDVLSHNIENKYAVISFSMINETDLREMINKAQSKL